MKIHHVIGLCLGILAGAVYVAKADLVSDRKCHLFVEKGVDGRLDDLNIEGAPGTHFIVGKNR